MFCERTGSGVVSLQAVLRWYWGGNLVLFAPAEDSIQDALHIVNFFIRGADPAFQGGVASVLIGIKQLLSECLDSVLPARNHGCV